MARGSETHLQVGENLNKIPWGATIQLLGGGLKPQAKYLFLFLRLLFSVYKVGSQNSLFIDVRVKERSEAWMHEFIDEFIFKGH